MTAKIKNLSRVGIGRLFLALDNPRFEPVGAESKAIAELCAKEGVYPLARDIALHGTSPLELFAIVPVQKSDEDTDKTNYYVAEGNRRICAIKLLNDPALAPPKLRKSFEKLAEDWTPIKTVPAVVFRDQATLRFWRGRIHNGEQGGVGRKSWNADQKSRHDGDSKNRPALALLDYAESEGMITAEQRKRKLTTAQRFLSNAVFRETIGVDSGGDVGRTRPKEEFDIIARRFIKDLIDGKSVHSRMNERDIIDYARPLNSITGVSTKRIPVESLASPSKPRSAPLPPKLPKRPDRIRYVQYDDEISIALSNLANEKLKSLYASIVRIEIENNVPLLAVGAWCFFETLTSCCGRADGTSLDSYLSKEKINKYGLASDAKTFRPILERIRDYGNTTKHHRIAAAFNGEQLNNDMVSLKRLIMACIAEAAAQPQ